MIETAPSPSQQPPIEHQAQLFNPDLLQLDQSRRDSAIRAINELEAGDPELANTPRLTEDRDSANNSDNKTTEYSIETYREAVDLINNGELPQDLRLKRDWSDTSSQHDEKRNEHQIKLLEALTKKIDTLERQKTQDERNKIDKDHKEDHNRKIEAREREKAERQAVKDEYLARQKLIQGEFKLTQDPALLSQVEKDADEYVNTELGKAKHQNYGVYDTAKPSGSAGNSDEHSDEKDESEDDNQSSLDVHNESENETQDPSEDSLDLDIEADDSGPETTATKELNTSEKFDHSQAFLPWALKNRAPGIRKLLKERKLGKAAIASMATIVDYAGTNIIDSKHYDHYMSRIEKNSSASSDDVKSDQVDSLTDETQEKENEAKTAVENIRLDIEHFNDLLKDPTYVPTVDEYREIVDLAGRIKIIHATKRPNGYEERGIKYFIEDSESEDNIQLNANAARKVIDASKQASWELSDKSIDQLDAALRLSVEPRLLALQQNRQREDKSDFLNYESFVKILKNIDNSEKTELIDSYHDYLQRRIELIEWFDSLEPDN